MSKQHKHCEVIKAWADGAVIQFFNPFTRSWKDLNDPIWSDENQYRIKPQTIRYRVGVYACGEGLLIVTAETDKREKDIENWSGFKGWVSDWIEVEV